MPSGTYAIIRQAIVDQKPVSAMYRNYVRELCPHVLGTKNGREQALFYQFGGRSSSGLDPDGSGQNWRCMVIGLLSDVELMANEGWHTAPNHSRPQSCVDEIDVEVT